MKYPRTAHLPSSPGGTRDDRRLPGLDSFVGRRLVATEKADGSNVCIDRDGCYARSHGHAPTHPSFDAFKAFHARVRGLIRPGIQVYGEWLYARHSIHYTALPGYFLAFGVRGTEEGAWASWQGVETWAEALGVPTVPVLGFCEPDSVSVLERFLRDTADDATSQLGGKREGFVLRWADGFSDADFDRAIGKYVRADHVTTDEHWRSQAVVRNRLKR